MLVEEVTRKILMILKKVKTPDSVMLHGTFLFVEIFEAPKKIVEDDESLSGNLFYCMCGQPWSLLITLITLLPTVILTDLTQILLLGDKQAKVGLNIP